MQYMGKYYEQARRMSAVDIIKEAYPWEIPSKLAETLVDRYNLTVVDQASQITSICAPLGVIFDGLTTATLTTRPHYEIEVYEIETTGVLFFDNSSAQLQHQHMFNDLIVPFDLTVWLICVVTCCFMSVMLKFLHKLQIQLAILAAFCSLIAVSLSTLKDRTYGRFYVTWLLGGAFISSAYMCMLHSNVVVPTEVSIARNISELHTSNYSIIGTSLFSVYDLFKQQYEQTLERLGNGYVNNLTMDVLQNYKKLLDMLERRAYSYKEQYSLLRYSKTALFGEMHNLNVLHHVLPAELRRKMKFTQESFFPKLKNFIFQLHHADIIVGDTNG